MKRLGLAMLLFAVGCAPEDDLPLPPGGMCLDMSNLENDQVEALLVASERWEPHFAPVRIEHNPSCRNHVWSDRDHYTFNDSKTPQAFTVINRTDTFAERDDTQLLLKPGMRVSQAVLEDLLTHEMAHIFGALGHWDSDLMGEPIVRLGEGLEPSDEDRARVGELYR